MVEFHYSKKRRGIASITGKSTRAVEPKPYWPGLEIDEHDKKGNGHGRVNNHINGNIRAVNDNSESQSDEETKEVEGGVNSSRMPEENSTSGLAPSTNDPKNTKTKRRAGDVPKFRSRKRKSKAFTNDVGSKANLPQKRPDTFRVAGEKREVRAAFSSSTSVSSPNVGIRDNARSTEGIEGELPKSDTAFNESVSGNDNTSGRATAIAIDSNLISSKKTNLADENKDDLSLASSSEGKQSGSTTPRALVTFLLKNKFPVLDDVLSNIRDILFGMVSQSPALVQKHLAKATATSHAVSDTRNDDFGKFQNGRWGSHEESISKLQDLCERQEILLDRMVGIESARKLESCRNESQGRDKKQQSHLREQLKGQQRDQEEVDLTTKLRRDYRKLQEANTSLQMKLDASNMSIESHSLELQAYIKTIQELEKSKRSIQYTFRSRFEEQFRELAERDLIIEKQRTLLRVARTENEKLRDQIDKVNRVRYQSPESNHFHGSDTSANGNFAISEGKFESAHGHDGHYAYSHRIRHSSSGEKQQQILCSLQATDVSAFGSSVQDVNRIPAASSTNSAYIPRIRRTASER